MTQVTKYVSNDNKIFDTPKECFQHELSEFLDHVCGLYTHQTMYVAEKLLKFYDMKEKQTDDPVEPYHGVDPAELDTPIDPRLPETPL